MRDPAGQETCTSQVRELDARSIMRVVTCTVAVAALLLHESALAGDGGTEAFATGCGLLGAAVLMGLWARGPRATRAASTAPRGAGSPALHQGASWEQLAAPDAVRERSQLLH
jgi:hypothetical protein